MTSGNWVCPLSLPCLIKLKTWSENGVHTCMHTYIATVSSNLKLHQRMVYIHAYIYAPLPCLIKLEAPLENGVHTCIHTPIQHLIPTSSIMANSPSTRYPPRSTPYANHKLYGEWWTMAPLSLSPYPPQHASSHTQILILRSTLAPSSRIIADDLWQIRMPLIATLSHQT